ncbi:hypothetical protein KKF97_17805 [Myxococcota bacterium]|nr:hypothetical protein [Myxococcota bacterium]MBU1381015.1 hypothetical protein [Myxococcota bacterium]
MISEFRTLGFIIKKLPSAYCKSSQARTELLENTEINRAVCGVMVSFEKGAARVEIWLHESKTGRKKHHAFEYSGGKNDKNAQTVALKTVERFRATLISLAILARAEEKAAQEKTIKAKLVKKIEKIKKPAVLLPRKHPPEVKPQVKNKKKITLKMDKKKITAFSVSAGPGFRFSPGKTPMAGQMSLAAGIAHISGFGGLLEVSSSFVSGDLESSDAHSDFNFLKITVWGTYDFLKYGDFVFSAGLGTGSVLVYTNSIDEISGKNKKAHTKVAHAGLKTDARWKITEYLSVFASIKCGVFLPRVDIYFRGEKKASAGLPELEISSGLTFFF